MKLVVFGLTISSSWGNGHATLWRSLAAGLAEDGHRLVFFERDVPYYAGHRDLAQIPGGELVLYRTWREARRIARPHLSGSDAAIVTSYCPDALSATDLIHDSHVVLRAFYDLDTPVTLHQLAAGGSVPWIGPSGLASFDVTFSFTGGPALELLRRRLGARCVAPLYGSADPLHHSPVPPSASFASVLSYLGTYSHDRQRALDRLFLQPAKRLREKKFLIGGSQYPESFPWSENVHYRPHVPPAEHPSFYCSSPLTLNVTRRPMAAMGFCPSGRLFEAAACGVPVMSDSWDGLESFFEPGREILIARDTDEAIEILHLPRSHLRRIGRAARARVLEEHTGRVRARQLIEVLERAHGARRSARAS